MTKSRIFTEAELKSLESRLQGSKKDDTGLYAARVKPKLQELYYTWFAQRKKYIHLVQK